MISSMYREYPAPKALAGLVECFWQHELLEAGSDRSGVILPDGRVDVVWMAGGQTLLAGPQTRFLPRPLRPPFSAIGARFYPGVGPPLLGLPAHELVDMHVPLAALDADPAVALSERLAALDAAPGHVAVATLSDALVKLVDRAETLDPLVRGAARLLDASRSTVRHIASELALSERQLQRRFRESVGYGPKTLHRILRFRRFLTQLQQGRDGLDGLAGIAASTGYADQAHLTRESRRLSGLSPSQLEQLSARSPSGS
jgi:AraC-like DNA-binding protein